MGDGGRRSFAFLEGQKHQKSNHQLMMMMIIINMMIMMIIINMMIIIMMTLTLKAATILLVICALVGIRFKISSSDGATASAEDYHYHTFYRL